jgi:hypothetical protein
MEYDMFNLNQYLNDLTVTQDDEELIKAQEIVELTALICDDQWLTRQAYYGMAGAMERQLDYLGGTLVPSTEARITRMASAGISSESYTQDSWFGVTNSEKQHINDELAPDQALDDAQEFKDGLQVRMRTAAIIFVTHMRAHDEVSIGLNQLTYSQIKAKAEANREAAAARRKAG